MVSIFISTSNFTFVIFFCILKERSDIRPRLRRKKDTEQLQSIYGNVHITIYIYKLYMLYIYNDNNGRWKWRRTEYVMAEAYFNVTPIYTIIYMLFLHWYVKKNIKTWAKLKRKCVWAQCQKNSKFYTNLIVNMNSLLHTHIHKYISTYIVIFYAYWRWCDIGGIVCWDDCCN